MGSCGNLRIEKLILISSLELRGYHMRTRLLHVILLIFLGLVSSVLLEIGVVALLTYAPRSIDLSGGFYWGVAFVLAVLLLLFRGVFAGLLRRGPGWYVVVYGLSFFASHHALLARNALVDSLTQPTPTQTTYNLLIGGGCLLLMAWVWLGRSRQG